jgi:hypothetical protein
VISALKGSPVEFDEFHLSWRHLGATAIVRLAQALRVAAWIPICKSYSAIRNIITNGVTIDITALVKSGAHIRSC